MVAQVTADDAITCNMHLSCTILLLCLLVPQSWSVVAAGFPLLPLMMAVEYSFSRCNNTKVLQVTADEAVV